MASRRVTRRDALKGLGATAALPALQACGDSTEDGAGGAGGGTVQPQTGITHIVVLMMENRSYDHYLGARKLLEDLPGDGLTEELANPNLAGDPQPIYHESVLCVADPPHGWDPARVQFNDGANDGFVRAYQEEQGEDVEPFVMGYFVRDDLPVTYALADEYTSCDAWFCSVMGPTWPNRFYFHAAQSGGVMTNDAPPELLTTIYDRLAAKGVTYNYYYTDLPFIVLLGANPNVLLQPAMPGFFDAAAAGTLPQVTVIDPGFALNDDHPPHHPGLGQQLISAIYQALATSPLWNNILFVVTYDEHGGFFDHVPPPKTADDRAAEGFDQLGFRVPTLIIGPYVKPGYVSSVQYDHTSILKHIENMFDLEPLTARDAAATDLSDAIDQDRLAAVDPRPPITLPVIELDASMIDDSCKTMGGLPKPPSPHQQPSRPPPSAHKSDIELYADRGLIPPEYDLRDKRYETALYIGDYLARHGLGGIRRGR